jgi:hypothetical protein
MWELKERKIKREETCLEQREREREKIVLGKDLLKGSLKLNIEKDYLDREPLTV